MSAASTSAITSVAGSSATRLDLTIAGLRLEFRAHDGLCLDAPGFEYPPFLAPGTARRRIRVIIDAGPPPELPPDAQLHFDTQDGWQLHGKGTTRWLRMPRRDLSGSVGPTLWQLSWAEPLREARLQVAHEQVHDGLVRHVIQYPLDQILLTHALLVDQALLLHAAGAVLRNTGVAFAGVSGAGKSTITRMLSGADDLSFLSDDRIVVCPGTQGFEMHGTPWAGDARVAEPASTALSAICFLRQSAAPALTTLEPHQALERLLPVATLPWFDAEGIGDALKAVEMLVSQVPCFELAFTLDPDDTRVLLDALPHVH